MSTEDAPLGKGVKEALEYMLQMGEKDGFRIEKCWKFSRIS